VAVVLEELQVAQVLKVTAVSIPEVVVRLVASTVVVALTAYTVHQIEVRVLEALCVSFGQAILVVFHQPAQAIFN